MAKQPADLRERARPMLEALAIAVGRADWPAAERRAREILGLFPREKKRGAFQADLLKDLRRQIEDLDAAIAASGRDVQGMARLHAIRHRARMEYAAEERRRDEQVTPPSDAEAEALLVEGLRRMTPERRERIIAAAQTRETP